MDSDGGGVATAVTSRRLTSHHSTLRDTFIAADLSDAINREFSQNSAIVNSNTSPRRVSNVTLGAVLNSDRKSPPPANIVVRTLLEVIRNDETLTPRSGGGSPNGKKTWKSFKDRLKLKRNQNFSQNPNSRNWTSSMPVPQSDVIPSSRSSLGEVMANRNSLRSSTLRRVDTVPADDLTLREVDSGGSPRGGSSFRLSAALAAEREQTRRRLSRELDEGNRSRNENEEIEVSPHGNEDEDEDGGIPNLGPPANQPLRMSLMDLLEETDRQAGISGPTYRLDDEEEEEEEEEEVEVEEEVQDVGKGEFSCCVCMVRHKGAAFIPCGHTFCRLCSRELFVQRGNCPLCNNFILEILDIF
ncbi:uncharacterized protein LOC110728136 [Chenopodium quinoa]|uniref:uncharacterized protein LOC110728136 n=1 Tax=Chenopodium quinoa TaxID=63459 RepID=UPI000B77D370|nr:uncharacterized protein LOC110728136 [Chenopodium quinoa]XP_021763475.1 uncharacterized protein LOC110728136 [Chenopodium quinoa]